MACQIHRRRDGCRAGPGVEARKPGTPPGAPPAASDRSRARRLAGLAQGLGLGLAQGRVLGLALGLAVLTPAARAELPPFEAELRIETRTRLVSSSLSGLLSVPLAVQHGQALPAVALVSEGMGPDGRATLYATRLLSLGIVVLELDFGGAVSGESTGEAPSVVPVERRLDLALALLREAPEVDPRRVAVIGLGEGGRAVLLARSTAAPPVAAALLYPGCDEGLATAAGLPAAARPPLLLLHGAEDPANEPAACAALAGTLGGPAAGVAHQVLRGATYAWDILTAPGPGGGRTWLPDPGGAPQRVLVEPDPVLAQIGLDRVLGFLLPRLQPAGER